MTELELKTWEDELNGFAKEIQAREKAAAQWERELAAKETEMNSSSDAEANRYDLFFSATNAKHSARPIAAVVLEPQPAAHGVSRADLTAWAAMILSVGALAAAIVSLLI